MKCHACELEARAICKFCGRAVCEKHTRTARHYSGYGEKIKNALLVRGSDTAIVVKDAVHCGNCEVEYRETV